MSPKYPDDVQCHPEARKAAGDPPVEHPPHVYCERRAKIMAKKAQKKKKTPK